MGLTPFYVCQGNNLYICKIVLGGIVESILKVVVGVLFTWIGVANPRTNLGTWNNDVDGEGTKITKYKGS